MKLNLFHSFIFNLLQVSYIVLTFLQASYEVCDSNIKKIN